MCVGVDGNVQIKVVKSFAVNKLALDGEIISLPLASAMWTCVFSSLLLSLHYFSLLSFTFLASLSRLALLHVGIWGFCPKFCFTYVQNSSATLALVLLFQNPLGNHYRTRRFIPNNLHSMSSGEKGGFFKQALKCSSRVSSLRDVVIREWD